MAAPALGKRPAADVANDATFSELQADWWERLTFSWLGPSLDNAAHSVLRVESLPVTLPDDGATLVTSRLRRAWTAEVARALKRQNGRPQLFRALVCAFGHDWLRAGLPLKTLWLGFVLAQVFAVRGLVRCLENLEAHVRRGGLRDDRDIIWACLLVASVQGVSLCQHHIFAQSQRVAMRVRTALCGCVYDSVLRLSAAELGTSGLTSGSLNNMLLSDARRVEEAIVYSHFTWHAAVELVVIIGLAFNAAGVAALGGAAAVFALVCITQSLAKAVGTRRKVAIAATDVRVRLTKEVLTHARAVKLNGWVPPFARRLADARATEMRPLCGAAQFRAASSTVRDSAAPAAALATFATLAALRGRRGLFPSRVFTVMALFNAVIRILAIAPMGLQAVAEAASGMQRLRDVLALRPSNADDDVEDEDDDEPSVVKGKAAADVPLKASGARASRGIPAQDAHAFPVQLHGTFQWCAPPPASRTGQTSAAKIPGSRVADIEAGGRDAHCVPGSLRHVTLRFPAGSLTAVVGPVGAGKSSLLLALLGELHASADTDTEAGSHAILPRNVAYAPQEAWVLNASVRDNILLGRPLDPCRYDAVIAACALDKDLASFPAGDATEVGERGVTLSGGQCARLSLARCVYGVADAYLIDDPISALDSSTARHVMHHCLCRTGHGSLLGGATRLLVTHAVAWLPACDAVVVLDAGHVVYHGPPSGIAGSETLLRRISADLDRKPDEDTTGTGDAVQPGSALPRIATDASTGSRTSAGSPSKADVPHALVAAEDRAVGQISGNTYIAYARAGGGALHWLLILFLYACQAGAYVATFLWLAFWADGRFPQLSMNGHIAVYAGITAGAASLSLARAQTLTSAALRAATRLHDVVLAHVLRAPVAFFDANPVGRILNRFTKDMSTLDAELPVALQAVGELFAQGLAAVVTVSALLPFFTVVIPPVLFFSRLAYRRYVKLSREVKRLDGITRSPVVSHFGVTLAGAPCVRAFAAQERFSVEFHMLLNRNNVAHWTFVASGRWLGIRMDALASLAAGVASACVLGAHVNGGDLAGTFVAPGLAGMALVASLTFAGTLQYATRQLSELENAMTSVERLIAYAELDTEAVDGTAAHLLPAQWPSAGRVDFQSVTVRYAPHLPPTLDSITFTVAPRAKIGVVGRTGAGKSTLVCSLFRLVENPGCTGRIVIDGIDISTLRLDDLRRCISLIPQQPVLFQGTLRDNLDPFHACSDLAIAALLPRLGLHIRAGAAGLACPVSEAGDNWSAGERQLVCLGRALLRASRLLVCDEATANVDAAADARIQAAIRTDFAECSVITVAHRLDTVVSCDALAVLVPGGRLAQYGEPHALLNAGDDSVFAAMVDATGPESSVTLRRIAADAAAARAAAAVAADPNGAGGRCQM